MRQLIRLELNKAFHTKWLVIALGIACALAAADAALNVAKVLQWLSIKDGGSHEWVVMSTLGSYTRWILLGASMAREIFFLLLPLLATLPFASSWRSEHVDGVLNQMYVRGRRGDVLAAKGLATFLTGFVLAVVPLVLSFVAVSCFLPAYVPEALDNLYIGIGPNEAFSGLLYGNPLVYVAVNTLVDGVLCGSWALLVLAVSTVVDNRVLLLVGSQLLMLVLMYLNKVVFAAAGVYGFRFALIYLLQGAADIYVRAPLPLALAPVLMMLAAVVLLRARRDSDVL